MPSPETVIALRGVRKDYHGLRPLRLERLDLREGASVALLGFDRIAAEVLVNLITGATLPDKGTVAIFGTDTASIADADTWMKALDDFGILSERVVLLDEMTAEQNLLLPLTLDIHDAADTIRAQVRAVAEEVGLDPSLLRHPAASLAPAARLRLRLGKALAARPRVLLAEHPNATLPPDDIPAFAADLSGIISRRSIAALILTADRTFGRATAGQVLTLQPATGDLAASAGWRQWFGG